MAEVRVYRDQVKAAVNRVIDEMEITMPIMGNPLDDSDGD